MLLGAGKTRRSDDTGRLDNFKAIISHFDDFYAIICRRTDRSPVEWAAVVTRPSLPLKAGPGRPRKFGRPSRAVTVTLPEDVLGRLHAVDDDLGSAIVRMVEARVARRAAPMRAAEIASYGNHAVIVVTPVKALRRLHGVELVPVGNGRALISLDRGQSVSQLELDIRDALVAADVSAADRAVLQDIADILRETRGKRGPALRERTIIVLEARRARAR